MHIEYRSFPPNLYWSALSLLGIAILGSLIFILATAGLPTTDEYQLAGAMLLFTVAGVFFIAGGLITTVVIDGSAVNDHHFEGLGFIFIALGTLVQNATMPTTVGEAGTLGVWVVVALILVYFGLDAIARTQSE